MSVLRKLGIAEIAPNDNYGKIQFRLAFDLVAAIKAKAAEDLVWSKALTIIQVCCEPELDYLIDFYEWNQKEVAYADALLQRIVEVETEQLLQLATRRVAHTRRHERRTGLLIEDCKIGALMSFVMDLDSRIADQIEASFMKDHGAMHFST